MSIKPVSYADPSIHPQGCPTCIGDILIHSEKKITIVPVVLQSPVDSLSITIEQPIIRRLAATSHSPVNSVPTTLGGDLKNINAIKAVDERTKNLSTKNMLRIHKAGWALVKELKSRVLTSKLSDENIYAISPDDASERTHF